MEDLLRLVALLLALLVVGVGLAALSLLCHLLAPALVERARSNAAQLPVRSFIVGLINFVFFGLIAAALFSGGELARLLGLVITTILFSCIAIGLTAVARLVGERLRPADPDAIRQLVAGIVILELAALVPMVGWFAVTLLASLIGYGATIIALVRRPHAAPQRDASAAPDTLRME